MKDNILYKIKPLEVTTYFLRMVSIFLILLLALNIKLNTLAFSFLMIIPVSFLLFSRTSRILLTKDYLLIQHICMIKKLSNITQIEICQIKEIIYKKEYKPVFRHLLPMSYILSDAATITIILHNSEVLSQPQIGSKEKFIGLYKELKKLT